MIIFGKIENDCDCFENQDGKIHVEYIVKGTGDWQVNRNWPIRKQNGNKAIESSGTQEKWASY